MTEKDKMLAGLPYLSSDAALQAESRHAKTVCHRFNLMDPGDSAARMAVLAELLHFEGEAHIEPSFYCDYGYNIRLGDGFYANHHLTILDPCAVTIGRRVMFGPHVLLSTATHPLEARARRETEHAAPIGIGDDVWLGGNVSVMPGVTIGDRAVIGAGSVVTRDVPADVVAVGNPCRVVRALEPSG
ncbi:sugar O-acetyltransferase [Halomonas sp. THAF12]|uniref:sugar O-acetyltransferase n=1 Tax=Halomonas sp. B23F22_10 TaxID=3459515 RepID=UPI00373F2BCE